MYFRSRFSSYEEFVRESFDYGGSELGKDEIELLQELDADDQALVRPRKSRSQWD